jgi:hypothetical protein
VLSLAWMYLIFVVRVVDNYNSNGSYTMGIHYDYKSTRGDKKMRKQQEREERRRRKKKNNVHTSSNTIPEDVVLTMDMLTDPNR